MILVRKNTNLLLDCLDLKSKSFLISASHFLTRLSLFTSTVEDPSPKSLFIVKYLINSLGLSLEEAIKASKYIAHIKSPSRPDSVLDFFKQKGFNDADIKRIILHNSRLLCTKVDSTLKPKFEGLTKLGFSETQVAKLVTTCPKIIKNLSYCNVLPKVEFLRGLLCSNENIIKAFSNDYGFLSGHLEKKINPNISFLRECQISDARIVSLMTKYRQLMCRPLNFLKAVIKRVDELGVPRGSGMFYQAFRFLCANSSDVVNRKIKLLGRLGFSEAEILLAIRKQPFIVSMSEKNLKETVTFLVKEARCEPSYVISHPSILGFSLNSRLIPRNCVLQLLRAKELLKKELDFYSIILLTERKFIEKFIFPYQKMIPKLHDVYLSSSGNVPTCIVSFDESRQSKGN